MAEKTAVDVKSQLRAYSSGVQSKAEILKQQAENQKTAAAKKPAAKGKRSS